MLGGLQIVEFSSIDFSVSSYNVVTDRDLKIFKFLCFYDRSAFYVIVDCIILYIM